MTIGLHRSAISDNHAHVDGQPAGQHPSACVCVCVCVCVWVCVFLHREGFFRLQDVQDLPEGTDQRSCVANIS